MLVIDGGVIIDVIEGLVVVEVGFDVVPHRPKLVFVLGGAFLPGMAVHLLENGLVVVGLGVDTNRLL